MTKRTKSRLAAAVMAGVVSFGGWACGGHSDGRATAGSSVNTPNIACVAVSEARLGLCVG